MSGERKSDEMAEIMKTVRDNIFQSMYFCDQICMYLCFILKLIEKNESRFHLPDEMDLKKKVETCFNKLNEFVEKIACEANNDVHVDACIQIKKRVKDYYYDQFKYMIELTSNADVKMFPPQEIRTIMMQNKQIHQKIVDDILLNF